MDAKLLALMENICANPQLADNPTIMAALAALTSQTTAAPASPARTLPPSSGPVERDDAESTSAPGSRICPPIAELTLLQATFFDNWSQGKIPNTPRYGVTFEGWTVAPDQIRIKKPQWKNNALLINHNGFPRRLAGWMAPTKKNPEPQVDDEYGNRLRAIWDASPEYHFGLFGHRTGGFHYLKWNFIRLVVEENMPGSLDLLCGDEHMNMTNWSTRTSADKPLSGFATHQCRMDITGEYKEGWGS